jgi:maleate isomerase
VGRFFTEAGFQVTAITGLRCPTAMDIARVPDDRLRAVVAALDGPGVDAIVQAGTNLSFMTLDEQEPGRPVIAIDAATLWHALREHGIADRVTGAGALPREH